MRRDSGGCYATLLRELELEEPTLYQNFLRMNIETLHFLLNLVGPRLQRQDTVMRTAISAGQRFAITLRFLATGMLVTIFYYHLIHFT